MLARTSLRLTLAIVVTLVVTSGVLDAVGAGSLASLARHLPPPWSVQTAELQRDYAAVVPPPWSNTDDVISRLQAQLRAKPSDEPSYVLLGDAYLQKAREVGDPTYYTKADGVLQKARQLRANDVGAIAAQGALALERHEFEEALQLGQRARALDPYSTDVLGIIADAEVQLGQDDAAAKATQDMVNLRPDLSSYARVSYIRELHGDLAGAIAAMQAAATAGGPSPENVAWTSWQLGTLYFNQGDLAGAQRAFERALATFPRYVHGEAGLAMVAAARGDYTSAIAHYTTALDVMPWPQYIINLGDVYAAAGHPDDAAREYGLVDAIERLFQANGVNVDMELSLFNADHHRHLPDTLALAQKNMQTRPSVMSADALAWAQYQAGDCHGAAQTEQQALRLGTNTPLMLFHAGMVAACSGATAMATSDLQQTIDLNPHFSVLYDGVAQQQLRALQADAPAIAAAGGK